MFDAAFNNTNPIIRLTAIDIIKYAFVVEGYQFRRGNVSKVIKIMLYILLVKMEVLELLIV